MEPLCVRIDTSEMIECGKPATRTHVLANRPGTSAYRIRVCDEHYAAINQSAAKMRVEGRRRPQDSPGHNAAYEAADGKMVPGMGGYGALD